jgi:hypothetical protein
MARYLLSDQIEKTDIKVNRNPITLMVDFDLPDEVRESMPYEEFAKVQGKLACTFYIEPQKGDILAIGGHIWVVLNRLIYPNYYRKHGPRLIPVIAVRYIGKVEDAIAFAEQGGDP